MNQICTDEFNVCIFGPYVYLLPGFVGVSLRVCFYIHS